MQDKNFQTEEATPDRDVVHITEQNCVMSVKRPAYRR
jgi:hypothetical protein